MAQPSRFALTRVAALARLWSGCSAVPGLASRPDRLSTCSTSALADTKARQHPAIVTAHGKRLQFGVINLVFINCRIATPQVVLASGWRLLCSRTAAHVKQGAGPGHQGHLSWQIVGHGFPTRLQAAMAKSAAAQSLPVWPLEAIFSMILALDWWLTIKSVERAYAYLVLRRK